MISVTGAVLILLILLVLVIATVMASSQQSVKTATTPKRDGGDDESTDIEPLARDYGRYLLSKRRKDALDTFGFRKPLVAELEKILERWTITVLNTRDISSARTRNVAYDPWTTPGHVLDALDATTKMRAEMAEKKVPVSLIAGVTGKIIYAKLPQFDSRALKVVTDGAGVIDVSAGGKNRYIAQFPRDRLAALIRRTSVDDVAAAALRYAALLSGSQQWSVPLATYRNLRDRFAISLECFASPFNSQLLELSYQSSGSDVLNFCSVFPEDAIFGSIGNFFEVDLTGRRCVINPPFVESLIERSVVKLSDAFKVMTALAGAPGLFLFVVPSWKDAKFYSALAQLALTYNGTVVELLPSDNYGYEDTSTPITRAIPARFSSTWFCFEIGASGKFEPVKISKKDLI